MLPPDVAAFTFQPGADGSDARLAARAAAIAQGGRVAVAGASRWELLLALARAGSPVVAHDPSRRTLAVARQAAEDAGLGDRLTLFAADPRDVDVPGGAHAALVPCTAWRLLVFLEARTQALGCLRRALEDSAGALCLDVDRVPAALSSARTLLREGPGRTTWWTERDDAHGIVTVTCAAPGVAEVAVDLADLSPEETVDEVRAAGFDVVSVVDAATDGPLGPGSARAFVVARPAAAGRLR